MAMRSVGSFTLRHSLVSFKVKTYLTVDNKVNGLKFNNLHNCGDGSHNKISLKNHCEACDIDIEYADIIKGHEYAPGKFAIFAPEEIKECGDETSVDLDITKFVPDGSIPVTQFEGTMNFLSPEGKGDFRSFATLQQAMVGHFGLGKLVTRGGHDHLVAIKPEGKLLLMYRLRPTVSLRNIEDVPQYDNLNTTVNVTELALAKQLIEMNSGVFDPAEAVSERTDRLHHLLDAKISGQPMPDAPEQKKEAPMSDLMTALAESLAKAASRKTAAA